jgi:ubiquinone/menaquinone biosynthesis C-methylase UbiE
MDVKMTAAAETYFEQAANEWDAIREGYFTEAVREAAIARAYLRPEWTVADVGGGTGFMTVGLASRVAQVHLLDGSTAMLEVARRNLDGPNNVAYGLMADSQIPLPDGEADAVFANMYLHHCTDPAAAIAEMSRILRPGGRLVITDMNAHDHAWMREEMADEWPGFERAQVKAWLREAGLVNTYVDVTEQSCCATSQEEPDARADISVFVAVGTKRVSGARDAVRAHYGAAAERPGGCGCAPEAGESCCSDSEFVAEIPLSGGSCCEEEPVDEIEWRAGYTDAELGAAPQDAASFSLGCGNPTAIASLKPGETVVDIGSGGGLDSFLSAQRVGPSGRVIGVDMTPQMLERARATAARNGFANVEFRQGHAEALPVEDCAVDVVMSNCVINLCEDKGRVFEEAFRVLREGGRLSVSDVVTSGSFPAALQEDPAQWSGCVSGALPEGEYLDLVRAAGFAEVQVQRATSSGRITGVEVYSVIVSARKQMAVA